MCGFNDACTLYRLSSHVNYKHFSTWFCAATDFLFKINMDHFLYTMLSAMGLSFSHLQPAQVV